MANVNALVNAARDGDADEVRRLVEVEKVNPNGVCPYQGSTPLMTACVWSRIHVVRYLVEEVQVGVEGTCWGGCAPLWVAAGKRDSTLVQILVEIGGANVDRQNFDSMSTALHAACRYGGLDVVRYLVERWEADITVKDHHGKTALEMAFDRQGEHASPIVAYLLPRVASVNERVLVKAWEWEELTWEIKEMVLQKFAVGRSANGFETSPIHSLVQFPLPSTAAFVDCIEHYPSSKLSILGTDGRLPIHAVLTSTNRAVRHPCVVLLLAKREPRSVCSRDSITGFYPYESVAATIEAGEDDCPWLDVVYRLFRCNPDHFLSSRGLARGAPPDGGNARNCCLAD